MGAVGIRMSLKTTAGSDPYTELATARQPTSTRWGSTPSRTTFLAHRQAPNLPAPSELIPSKQARITITLDSNARCSWFTTISIWWTTDWASLKPKRPSKLNFSRKITVSRSIVTRRQIFSYLTRLQLTRPLKTFIKHHLSALTQSRKQREAQQLLRKVMSPMVRLRSRKHEIPFPRFVKSNHIL